MQRISILVLSLTPRTDIALTSGFILTSDDVFNFGVLYVSKSVNDIDNHRIISSPNYNSVRRIALTPKDLRRLRQYDLLRSRSVVGYFCRDVDGDYITVNQLQHKFKQLLRFCELPDLRFHDLRHSYATSMLRAGVHPKVISSVLGHSDISTTLDIYSHYDLAMQDACLSALKFRDNEIEE